jgi:hypothetical protein
MGNVAYQPPNQASEEENPVSAWLNNDVELSNMNNEDALNFAVTQIMGRLYCSDQV